MNQSYRDRRELADDPDRCVVDGPGVEEVVLGVRDTPTLLGLVAHGCPFLGGADVLDRQVSLRRAERRTRVLHGVD